MSDTAMDVVYLAGCAVNGTVPDNDRVQAMDLEAVYAFASWHMIGSAVAFALESAGFRDQKSAQAIASAVRKTALFEQAWKAISEKLENAKIWYMPLKGAVLKNMYPKYGMREFVDYDILFDASRADEMKAIMEDLGFKTEYSGSDNHDCYCQQPCLSFEMHRTLFDFKHDEKLWEYHKDIETRLIRENGYERRFTPEDFYLYFLAHEYKHYADRGTGLRSLMDAYIYLKHTVLNTEYIAVESEKMGLSDFEKQNRSLAFHLFSEDHLTESDRKMLDYILSSGTYGTASHRVQNNVQNKLRETRGSKILYMLDRFFVPFSRKNKKYDSYAETYPFFYRHRILLPLLPFYRIFQAIRTGRFQAEAKAFRDA